MLNMVKMDLFRLFKTKSLYVSLAIMATVTVLFTYLLSNAFDQIEAAAGAAKTETAGQPAASDDSDLSRGFSAGLHVSINTEEDSALPPGMEDLIADHVTILSMLSDLSAGLLLGLFVVIFTVLFATADTTSGFIKNIGGQVPSRSVLILSKAVCLFVYTVVLFTVYLLVQGIATQLFFGYVKPGDTGELASYLAVQVLLHFALALFCMMLAVVIKNNVVSIIIAVLLCADFPTLLFRVINQLAGNLGVKNFDISRYSLTHTISVLEPSAAGPEFVRTVCIGSCFIVFSILISCFIFKKRDIA